jgi:hypothetical protein
MLEAQALEQLPPAMIQLQHRRHVVHGHDHGPVWCGHGNEIPRIPHDIGVGTPELAKRRKAATIGELLMQRRQLRTQWHDVGMVPNVQRAVKSRVTVNEPGQQIPHIAANATTIAQQLHGFDREMHAQLIASSNAPFR